MLKAVSLEVGRIRTELGPDALWTGYSIPLLATWVIPLAVQHAHEHAEILGHLQRLDRLLSNAVTLQTSLKESEAERRSLEETYRDLAELPLESDCFSGSIPIHSFQRHRELLKKELFLREQYAPLHALLLRCIDDAEQQCRRGAD